MKAESKLSGVDVGVLPVRHLECQFGHRLGDLLLGGGAGGEYGVGHGVVGGGGLVLVVYWQWLR